MADASHTVAALSQDRFVDTRASFQSRYTYPPSQFADNGSPASHPWMKLSGRWIDEAGFEAGQCLHIEVTHKRVVITPIDDARRAPFSHDEPPHIEPATRHAPRPLAATTGDAQ